MAIRVFKTVDELLHALASYFITVAQDALAQRGACNVVLAGGNSPKKLYQLLSSDTFRHQIDWQNIYFFFGDERYVPLDDPQNNAHMAQQFLFDPLHISPAQVFKIDTRLSPDDAAAHYQETIATHFKHQPVHFDFMLLGLGDNAHTASLFPFVPVLTETAPTVKAVFLKELNTYRITMTAPLINQSKHIAFLVYGEEKAEAVAQVIQGETAIEKYPAQLIQPTEGELDWFLDGDAGALLKG